MPSFDMRFNKDGTVSIYGIAGVQENTDECTKLTKSYEDGLGKIQNRIHTTTGAIVVERNKQTLE